MSFKDASVAGRVAVYSAATKAAKAANRVVMGGQSQAELYADADKAVLETLAAARNVGLAPNLSIKGNDVFFIGDSITAFGIASSAGNNTGTMYAPLLCAQSWPGIAMGLSGGRLRYAGQAATGGYTSAQIKSTHLPSAVAAKPTFCVIMCGRNDVRTLVPSATTLQNIQDMCTTLIAAGIEPVLCSMAAQSGNSAEVEQLRYEVNKGIRDYANSMRLVFVDLDRVTRTGDGQWIAGYNQDVSHPTPVGCMAMAKELVNSLLGRLPAIMPIRPGVATGNGNLLPNGGFDGLAEWTVTGTPSTVDGVCILKPGDKVQEWVTAVVGAKYSFNVAFKVDGDNPNVRLYVQDGPTATPVLKGGVNLWRLAHDWLYMTFEYTSTNASTSVIIGSTTGTLSVAEVGIYPMV